MQAVQVAPYAKYLDCPLSAIGISVRNADAFENHLGIITVRELLYKQRDELLSTPQVSFQIVDEVFQCLADIGLKVPGFTSRPEAKAAIDRKLMETEDELAHSSSARLYWPSRDVTPPRKHVVYVKPVFPPKDYAMPRKKASKATATSTLVEQPQPEVACKVVLDVSREIRAHGPFIRSFSSPVPVPMESCCFIILLDETKQTIFSTYMVLRPAGVTRQVLVYTATSRQRPITSSIDSIGDVPVMVEVSASYDDLITCVDPDIQYEVQQRSNEIERAIKAFAANDLGAPMVDPQAIHPAPPATVAVAEPEHDEDSEIINLEQEEVEYTEGDLETDSSEEGWTEELVEETTEPTADTAQADEEIQYEEVEVGDDESLDTESDDSSIEYEEYEVYETDDSDDSDSEPTTDSDSDEYTEYEEYEVETDGTESDESEYSLVEAESDGTDSDEYELVEVEVEEEPEPEATALPKSVEALKVKLSKLPMDKLRGVAVSSGGVSPIIARKAKTEAVLIGMIVANHVKKQSS
jgi:hypothetical protein